MIVNDKQGEFFYGIWDNLGTEIAKKCLVVPSSQVGKHLTVKALKTLGVDDYINYIIDLEDYDKSGKIDVNDFLDMDNNEILKKNGGKKFDICLMNPPFQGATLHLQFIEKCIEVSENTIVICPASWIDDYAVIDGWKKSPKQRYINKLGQHLIDYEYFKPEDFQKIFDIATWTSGMIGLFNNNKTSELYKSISDKQTNKFDKEIIEKAAKLIYTGQQTSVTKMYRKHKGEDGYDWFIKLTRVHGHVNNKDQYDNIAPDIKYSLNVKDKEQKEVYFKTKDEAINFFESIKTTFCKYLRKLGCYGSGDFNGGLPFMDDYTEPWTTHRFCEYFGISKDTEDYIDKFFEEFYKSFEK